MLGGTACAEVHGFAAQAHRSGCQRVLISGMLLIKEPELSSVARACPKPAAPPGSRVLQPPTLFCAYRLAAKMKENGTFFILSSACQSQHDTLL